MTTANQLATLGNGPSFSAYASAGTATSHAGNTKILFQTETYDTNNNFASSRFTPTVAGYYQFTAVVYWGASTSYRNVIYVTKNGGFPNECFGMDMSGSNYTSVVANQYYANGTTDYFEVMVYQQSGGTVTTGTGSYFQASLIRGA